jgi:nucleotide-binding universal stress UspA family protein
MRWKQSNREEESVETEKDRYGEKLKLVRRARENIYFAEKDRQLIARLRTRLQSAGRQDVKVKQAGSTARKTSTASKLYFVPVDFSNHSETALRHAASMARENNAKLLLAHVLDEKIFFSGAVLPADYTEILEKQARESLEKIARRARLDSVQHQFSLFWGADAARTIADQAKKLGASMIVMGSHGRTGLNRLLLGSVAERTLRYAECPVMIVKK